MLFVLFSRDFDNKLLSEESRDNCSGKKERVWKFGLTKAAHSCGRNSNTCSKGTTANNFCLRKSLVLKNPKCLVYGNSDTDSIYRFTNKVEGRSVAICEGNPQLARGRTKEQVVRILTPCTCQQCQNGDHNFSFKDPLTIGGQSQLTLCYFTISN